MLKIFRRIRRNLIDQGRLNRYLLYAIGEIVLVVIGILIALQINNWNEERKSLKKEQIILQDLYKDLESNTAILQQDIINTQEVIRNIEFILNHFENNLPYSDSLAANLWTMQFTYQLVLVTSGFESLKSLGFDILQSNELRLQIINLYDREYKGITQWINTVSHNKAAGFQEVFSDLPRGVINRNYFRNDHYQEVIENDKLYNMVSVDRGWKNETVRRLTNLLEETGKVKEMVRKELKAPRSEHEQ